MVDPHKWLQIVRRAEVVCGWAGAVTLLWMISWYHLCPLMKERTLTGIMIIVLLSFVLSLGTWYAKLLLTELIDDERMKKEWKQIEEGRWPSG